MSDILTLTLKKYWGFDFFRPLQKDIIKSVLDGHDTLGLMPTGGGKSITFQVPGMILEGLTLVITPLISLMKDQVDNLKRHNIRAVYFHAGMTHREATTAWDKLINSKCKFLYVSPERLSSERFCNELKSLNIRLIVIDEAHCISQWGYDFRPSYLNIQKIRKIIPNAPFLALTATATPEVVTDICNKLNFKDNHKFFKKSFSRPNIQYIVRPTESKLHQIVHILNRVSGSAIVYVRSRKRTKEIAEQLIIQGISAANYHAGLSFEDKQMRQDSWKNGEIRVIVATNAFGMGIDKPDVRIVIHHDLPPSLEEYYQEAGRAGRDEKHSYAVLLPAENDKSLLRKRVTESFPPREVIIKIYDFLSNFLCVYEGEGYNKLYEFNFERFCHTFKLNPTQTMHALKLLTAAQYIEYIEEAEVRSRVMIVCDKEDLYNIKTSHRNIDNVLQAILRLYPGLFADYVYINEVEIASRTKLSEQDVYDALLELTRNGILHYIPRKRTPYIFYPTAREDSKYIIIPKSIYEDRKRIISNRVESMIDYAYNTQNCRVKRMLEYFGEHDANECEKCDVCLSQKQIKRKNNNPDSDTNLITQLLDYIKSKPNGVQHRIITHYFGSRSNEISEMLQFLCDEKYITFKDGFFYYNNK